MCVRLDVKGSKWSSKLEQLVVPAVRTGRCGGLVASASARPSVTNVMGRGRELSLLTASAWPPRRAPHNPAPPLSHRPHRREVRARWDSPGGRGQYPHSGGQLLQRLAEKHYSAMASIHPAVPRFSCSAPEVGRRRNTRVMGMETPHNCAPSFV